MVKKILFLRPRSWVQIPSGQENFAWKRTWFQSHGLLPYPSPSPSIFTILYIRLSRLIVSCKPISGTALITQQKTELVSHQPSLCMEGAYALHMILVLALPMQKSKKSSKIISTFKQLVLGIYSEKKDFRSKYLWYKGPKGALKKQTCFYSKKFFLLFLTFFILSPPSCNKNSNWEATYN